MKSRHKLFGKLLVMTLLAVVAAILFANVYIGASEHARGVQVGDNMRLLSDTIRRFHEDTGRYPHSLEELVTDEYRNLYGPDYAQHVKNILSRVEKNSFNDTYEYEVVPGGFTITVVASPLWRKLGRKEIEQRFPENSTTGGK